ncbi:MAG: hypothetical protein KDE14_00370 [Rhodobacteraceae bacterium]|nr:hypothetical protein [Paracoccaceae bacterium]
MKLFAVICLVVGVAALGTLTVRRGRGTVFVWMDSVLAFIGLAGAIAGVIILFNRF